MCKEMEENRRKHFNAFEKVCKAHSFGKTLLYTRIREEDGKIHRGPAFKSVVELLEVSQDPAIRVNRYLQRTFDVRKYDSLRFVDQGQEESFVLIDDDLYDILINH